MVIHIIRKNTNLYVYMYVCMFDCLIKLTLSTESQKKYFPSYNTTVVNMYM